MYAAVKTGTLIGLDAELVVVETDLANGLPGIAIVGLPDLSIREARERIRAALKNSGYSFPAKRITVNLCPGDSRKEGTHFDLPIAISLMTACGFWSKQRAEGYAYFGELSLEGAVRPVRGALPLALGLKKQGVRRVLLPAENLPETALVSGLELYPVRTLTEAAEHLNGQTQLRPARFSQPTLPPPENEIDFADVVGQAPAKRALTIAAAGAHNILLSGPPGAGKTMLAIRLAGILPALTYAEQLEVTKVQSLAGRPGNGLINQRPFRQPHHTIPVHSLVGGGGRPEPGEVTLAHLGVLFLDELPEFGRAALEALRQPLEERRVTVARLSGTITYPADFILVAAMNPCPCGYWGNDPSRCRCTPLQIHRYQKRISGPLLDRIDLVVDLQPVAYAELADERESGLLDRVESGNRATVTLRRTVLAGPTSRQLRAEVEQARARQLARAPETGVRCNSGLAPAWVKRYCRLDQPSASLLEQAFRQYRLSARSYQRILKVARTIADLAGSQSILPEHLAEALCYRPEPRRDV